MKKSVLIIFPGEIDNIFFINEIRYAKQNFDRVIAFVYKDNKDNYDVIASKYDIEYVVIDVFSAKSLLNVTKVLSSENRAEFSHELKLVYRQKDKWSIKIKKIGYVLFHCFFALQCYREFLKLKLFDYDIYLYSYWMSRGATACSYIKNRCNVKAFVTRAHRYDLYEERNSLNFLPFRKYIWESVDSISFISEHGREYYKNKYKVIDEKLKLSYLGVRSNEKYRKKVDHKNRIDIVSCSNVIEVKRLDLIIEFLSKLTIDFHWYHIGDGELLNKITKLAKIKLSPGTYEFIGRLDNEKIVPFYFNHDIDYFINLSDSEGLPVSIMEAFSIGIPAIARPVGGIRELVDEETGFLLDADITNDNAFSQAREFIYMRLKEPKRYQVFSENAFLKWKNFFERDKNYSDFYNYLKQMD
jgi:hypothetical protein